MTVTVCNNENFSFCSAFKKNQNNKKTSSCIIYFSPDVPPLEDMTGILQSTNKETREVQHARRTALDPKHGSEGAKSFGGLKKGFLTAKHKSNDDSGSAAARPPPKCPPNNDSIPYLRRNADSLEIPEVQDAMKNAAPLLASRG